MNRQLQRQRIVWFVLGGFLLWMAATAAGPRGLRIGPSARADAPPLPVNVSVPASVLFDDNFGESMAIDGDTLVVGAPWTTVNDAEQQGVAYIYTRAAGDPTAFTLLKSITGSDSAAHEEFGWSVAIHGDTLVVGNADSEFGAAYVFERNQGGENNWGEVKKLARDDNRTFTYFGQTLAIHNDTIVVGASLGLGEAFIFERNQDGENQWGKTQTLDSGLPITTSPKVADFGEIIAFDGDNLVISAPQIGLTVEDVPGGSPTPPPNFVGAVFIYHQENGQWTQEAELFSSDIDLDVDPLADDVYGASLALNGDTLFVGAIGGNTNGVHAGKVFVYQRGAGTPPSFGQPGAWGEIAQLSPSDGVVNDQFGRALYAVDDGLFISSEKQGVGKVYFFRNPAGVVHSSEAAPQALLEWGEVYSFSTSANGSSTEFGLPLTGSGNSVVIGDRAADGGRGGIAAYAKDALFAVDPNATPTPMPSPTPTETPLVPTEPCVSVLQANLNRAYLPMIAGSASSPATAATATQPAGLLPVAAQPRTDTAPSLSILAPGCIVSGPGGVKLGAVAGAITQTIALTMETTAAPPEALPEGATPAGDFLRISSAKNKLVDMETPFVIAVPAGSLLGPNVDTSHLTLVVLLPAARTLDSRTTGNVWEFLPGVYDAASGLFLARLPFLLAEGATFLLVEHPDFATPANGLLTADLGLVSSPKSAVTAAGETVRGEFSVYCVHSTFNRRSDCTETMQADAKAMLDEIYQRMTDRAFFSFPRKLRLLDSGSQFIVSETISVTALSASYAAYIQGPKARKCEGNVGYYNPELGFLALCTSAGNPVDGQEKETLIHEFFHAVEFTYPAVWLDRDLLNLEEQWIIEGMAMAAERSYADVKMKRSPSYGAENLQKVDQPLTTGLAGDGLLDEYLAQDFWVYVGASENQSLAYFGPILTLGGAHRSGIDYALRTLFQKSLNEFYWGWVKNQTVENAYDVGEGPGVFCELSEDALKSGAPVEFPSIEQVYPFDTQSAFDRLPPLTAKVIEIEFGDKTSATVHIGYESCVGLQDPVAREACVIAAQQTLKSKIYVEGEPLCTDANLPGVEREGERRLEGILQGTRYFVVVANADLNNEHGYDIAIE